MNILAGGGTQLNLVGLPGWVYRLDASTNLIDWNPMVSISSVNGILQFTDAGGTNQSRKFYRAVAP